MRPFRKPSLVTLRRSNPSQAWGFRLGGGAEIGQPFQIQKVTPNSLAYLGGLSEGDELVRIGNVSLRGLTHDEVQQIILRCTHCIDLFIVNENDREIEPRIERDPSIINERSEIQYMERPPHHMTESTQHKLINHNDNYQEIITTKTTNKTYLPNDDQIEPPFSHFESGHSPLGISPTSPSSSSKSDFNRSARPFDNSQSPQIQSQEFKPVYGQQQRLPQQQHQPQPKPRLITIKPGVLDPRVFGASSRSPSKSPNQYQNHHSTSPNEIPSSPSPVLPAVNPIYQSIPNTPTYTKNRLANDLSFPIEPQQRDSNNNPSRDDKKIYGLPSRGASKMIEPMGNHGVQPVVNDRKFFGVNPRQQRFSISSERDWKDPLPLVNIPNTDQLLPSQTRQMQTYINQAPPTERNLRPSLSNLQRRRIRPVWPPPHPGRTVNKGLFAEDRDSPNTKMFNWPPSRAQSVDRDFGYGDRPSGSPPPTPGVGRSRPRMLLGGAVQGSCRLWPPPSNATPAGRSGYIPDENDEINYAYISSRETSPGPGWIQAHVPNTYRAPPETQYAQMIQDF